MLIENNTLKKILVEQNYLEATDIKEAEAKMAETRYTDFYSYLIAESIMTRDLIGQAIAEHYGVPYADLNSQIPDKQLFEKIPEELSRKYRVVAFKDSSAAIALTTDDPSVKDLVKNLEAELKKKVTLMYSLPEDVSGIFVRYQRPLETRFSKILEGKNRIAPEVIDEIISDALGFKASDIHLEPSEETVLIRFRVDGVLKEAGVLPKMYYDNIVNRVKVQAKLRTDEHNISQDGSIRYKTKEGYMIDLRVSVMPTVDGEKIAIRILGKYVREFTLGDLGLSTENEEIIQKTAELPFGMILVTGPTGSGKSTTLYALLKILNSPQVNITTIEDPVEYKIPGVNQIQVNEGANLTFARGLRSIVRQDPDIILVGEIRDTETAEIAVNAALTGHLLLSTFHANDASTAIPRLLDMGIEPFLLASTLELIVAQRLVRTICDQCRYSITVPREDIIAKHKYLKKIFTNANYNLYAGKGCESCGGSGYIGRIALFEFIRMTPEMEELTLEHPSGRQVEELARKQGTRSMFEDGIDKVLSGATTLTELLRVVQPPTEATQ
jgi:type IV pilus assembly protein PilB